MKSVVAVIGCGRIANGAHLPALNKMDDVRIKYACDILIEKAEAAKAKYEKIENVTADYKEVLADPEVEAVWVLTPNYAHYTVTMDALRAGKHVFCEKPITVNYELSCEMAAEANKLGKILNIGVCNRYHRSVEKLRELNEKGEFGNIYHVTARSANAVLYRVLAARSPLKRSPAAVFSSTGESISSILFCIFSATQSSKTSLATRIPKWRRI